MRRNLSKGLVRSARQAALVSTLGLVIALAVGVGGYFMTTTGDGGGRPASGRPSAAAPPPKPVATGTALDALAAVPYRAAAADMVAHALSVIPVREQARAASREALPAEPATANRQDSRPAESPLATTPAAATPTAATASAPAPNGLGIVTAAAFSASAAPAAALPVDATPVLAPGQRLGVSISFYYCERGAVTAARGDGGGFCGTMRDGSVVYDGAAACDVAYLGERFRILGDPLQRIYKCADTGSAVHGLHRDVWFHNSDEGWNWQLSMGQWATVEILP